MNPTSHQLVSSEWLKDHLHDPQVVVVDCRFSLDNPTLGQRQYTEGHIPGAYYLDLNQDLSSPVGTRGGRHPLPDLDGLAQRLDQLGIWSHPPQGPTLVVAYDASRMAFASRLWWLLRYLGHDAVAILDGGWPAWQTKAYPVEQVAPDPRPGQVSRQPHTDWVVSMDYVRQHKDEAGTLLIDSRSAARYRGDEEPIDPVAGHIPGAVNYCWMDVTDGQGYVRSQADLAQHWAALDQANEVIVYCGSGVTACVNLFSQVIAGQPMHRLYVGGWSEWCTDPEFTP